MKKLRLEYKGMQSRISNIVGSEPRFRVFSATVSLQTPLKSTYELGGFYHCMQRQ